MTDPPGATGGILAMSCLGSIGRFGNQVVQYMFAKTYARAHGLELQLPPWIGNTLFGADDPPITVALPLFEDRHDKDPERMLIPRRETPLRNVDAKGYFQYPSSYYAPHRDYIQRLFVPPPPVRAPLDTALDRLRGDRRTLVALHLRRGDFGKGPVYIVPSAWYLRWLDTIWDRLERPLLYIATDDPRVLRNFRRYAPVSGRDLGVSMPATPYFPDFYTLTQAEVLAIPNSTFSFAAAMLNTRLREAWRSHLSDPLEDPPFRRIDPWDAPILRIDSQVTDFPAIPGIRRRRLRYRLLAGLLYHAGRNIV